MSRTGGLEKQGRIGRVKERKERGKGREVNKVFCSLLVGALWPVVRVRRRPGTKGSQLWLLGLVHWQASWPLSTPSGQDVSLSEEELKSLLMKVKEESEKVGLKCYIQKTKIMASGPITSWQIDGETMETVTDFILGGSKITADGA